MTRMAITLGVLAAFAPLAVAAPVPRGIKKPPNPEARPFMEVMEKVQRETGLIFLDLRSSGINAAVELVYPPGPKLPLADLFDNLNEQLEPHGLILRRKPQVFVVEVLAK